MSGEEFANKVLLALVRSAIRILAVFLMTEQIAGLQEVDGMQTS